MISKQILRNTILGKITWKPCPMCDGTMYQNWDQNGNDVKSGRSDDNDRCTSECENCNGIGFIQALIK